MRKKWFSQVQYAFAALASTTLLTLSVGFSPTLAQDPFRATNQRQIGDNTEAAFKAIFEQGNYQAAVNYLNQAATTEPNEPLAFAMKASLAYTLNNDINAFSNYGKRTLETGRQLIAQDPLRGNLYAAVGHFLQGAAALAREGTVRGTPQALSELRQVYAYLDKAEAIAPNDPELNLLRGYMDLMLAVNLPFSSPQQAIDRLVRFAGPRYLADRGLAIGYRDLDRYTEALTYVDRAIQATPNNPELYYLKAQILAEQGNKQNNPSALKAAVENFDRAIAKKDQLPSSLVQQIERERNRTVQRVSGAS
ncbi:Sll0314/Alr1548 family TPR repeat-containing protein [Chroococcidiopsis sp. TS-821]|uniref:Sll0314/Alr1548 family TPR repeat-containing protein n=1 Tax=Chroococcidiopsis sp. TS-821 TaxID=1378066 RepID=UPI000CED9753|nr:Sll0314/Alr1548 family TPR repeat-containing protein [Chroococcidiopsis sp. TS-821]PPS43322.1 hypothetical protein B1A85_11510 [Chroococcidiopsis sp. TS-821]